MREELSIKNELELAEIAAENGNQQQSEAQEMLLESISRQALGQGKKGEGNG